MSIALSNTFAELNQRQRAFYPDGLHTLLSALCLGASGDLLIMCKPTRELKAIIERNLNGKDIRSATVIYSRRPLLPEYIKKTKACVKFFSIKDDVTQTAAIINKYIYDQCGLNDIVSVDMLVNSELIGINTLYFKDSWVKPFETIYKLRKFSCSNKTTVDLQYMGLESDIPVYIGPDGEVAVAFHFKNGAVAEFIMGLPITDGFASQIIDYKSTYAQVKLPKFKHSEKIELDNVAQMFIYKHMYTPGNLSSLTGDNRLAVDTMFQQIECEFNEIGAEVKAVTCISVVACSARCGPILEIVFDESFHYRIKKQDTILVTGYYDGLV